MDKTKKQREPIEEEAWLIQFKGYKYTYLYFYAPSRTFCEL